jgi:hypothetical protein
LGRVFFAFPGGVLRTVPAAGLALLISCSGSGDPALSLKSLFSAAKEGRGERAVSLLSHAALDSLEAGIGLERMWGNPGEASSLLASYGIGMSAGEIDTIGTAELMIRLVESPLFSRIMEDASLETGNVTVSGSLATVGVELVFLGDTLNGDVQMVLEDGKWKVGGEGVRFAFQ